MWTFFHIFTITFNIHDVQQLYSTQVYWAVVVNPAKMEELAWKVETILNISVNVQLDG